MAAILPPALATCPDATAFVRARSAALRRSALDRKMPPLALELHEEAIDAGLPPNAHRMGESQETGVPANPPASVIRDVNLVTVDGRPIAYVYRMENAAFLLQADLRARGALAVLTDPDRQLPAGAVVEPMRGRNGKTIPASHLFLPQRPNANASRCTLRR